MTEKIQQNEFMEQDQITISLKKRAARLLAKSNHQNGRMRKQQRKEYINTVRALEAHLAEQERNVKITDPYRPIYEFFLQEMGQWYGEGNPGPSKKVSEV